MKPPLRILMTACGAPGAPGILKCLKNNGEREIYIYGVDTNPLAVGFTMTDGGETCLSGQSEGYAHNILEIAKRENIHAVLPLSTMELEALAKAKNTFKEQNVSVCVSDTDGLAVANNKGKLIETSEECGVPVPTSYLVNSINDFRKAIKMLGFPRKPVCFKPAFGKGSRGFRIIDESQDKFKTLFDQKPGSPYTSMEEITGILEKANRIPSLLVMEYLPGDEYSVDVLCDEGKSLVVIPRIRNTIKLGICFIGTTEKNEKLIEFSKRIISHLRLSYCINLQFKFAKDGTPKLLEINPRVSGTIILCAGAGVNLPYLAVKLALGEPLGKITPSWGVRMIRYWDEIFYNKNNIPFALPNRLDHLYKVQDKRGYK